jgi:hypothetical protein
MSGREANEMCRHDRLNVEVDGEEREVYNWINVTTRVQLRGNGSREQWVLEIGAEDSRRPPEYVTHWLAAELASQMNIQVEDHAIDVVDIESEEVTVL